MNSPVLLHLHIPKTAGMALNDAIFEIYQTAEWSEDEENLISGVYYYPAGIDPRTASDETAQYLLSRADVRAVVGHFKFGLHEWIAEPCEYVTMLRHPVDRVMSLYQHIKTWDNDYLHEEVVSRNMSVTEFARELELLEVDNGQTRRIAGVQPPFGKCDEHLLEQAENNLREHFVVVGLTEKFAESVALMKRRLGWPRLPRLRRKNVNRSKSHTDTLSPDALSAIVDKNRLDLQLYEFATNHLLENIEAETDGFAEDLALARRSLEEAIQPARC